MFDALANDDADGPTVPAATALRLLGTGSGHDRLAVLASTPPSAATIAVLAAIDLDALNAHDRVSALVAWERHRGWLDGRVQAALVAVGGPTPPEQQRGDDWAREEVACALRLSTTTAGMRLDVARQLAGRLTDTGRA
jgi:hypothetical protein